MQKISPSMLRKLAARYREWALREPDKAAFFPRSLTGLKPTPEGWRGPTNQSARREGYRLARMRRAGVILLAAMDAFCPVTR
jgi:hypothetical protein